ncbi:MAG: hypothetical protein QOJ50_2315 [Cryptosporangiaceae bacterium]|nr:hypothetical protein [Cryptosporangiaceae bacterium]
MSAGVPVQYLFFWGHRPNRDGSAGSGCLSQWWPAAFEAEGIRYATAEHYTMAGKARLFGEHAIAARIVAARSPGAAKALGRQVPGFDQATWDEHRIRFATGSRVLVEASPRDRIGGIGLTAADPRALNPDQWPGLDLPGFALMTARERLTTECPHRATPPSDPTE